MAKKSSYHHGDLANALIEAALAIVEEAGLEGLSLRKVAARVGVSHAAPEHHFPTIKHLLNAMAIIGFQRFNGAMRSERSTSAESPAEQLRAAGRGYLDFAKANPALFRLMFTATLLDWNDETLQNAAGLAYSALVEICAPAADHLGLKTAEERTALEHLVWSQIHGQAHLMIDDKLPAEDDLHCAPAHRSFDIASLIFRT